MTQEELIDKYKSLYSKMAVSNDPSQMKLFGSVMNEMMMWIIKNQPTAAEQWIEKLCAVDWEQYLTKAEATKIVDKMEPDAPWGFDEWQKAMNAYGLETERKGVFNKFALWTEMNAKYSDQADNLAKFAFDEPIDEVDEERMLKLIHALAIGSLTDKDGVYKIRKYFLDE